MLVTPKPTPHQRPDDNVQARRRWRGAVLHIAEGSEASVDSWFAGNPNSVSAHFLVGLDGDVRQYVGLEHGANHAGRKDGATWKWLGTGNPNDYLLGIEGDGRTKWPEAQLVASTTLAAWLCRRYDWQATEQYFPMHRQIFAGKTCPGPAFNHAAWLERTAAVLKLYDSSLPALIEGIF
jgi:N-acetyl-anhydromuramyl-L-alanine amidase AmpD